jgi:DNA polymerase I-like protein with 3'-5' exonuclease and polymerase domains
LYGAGPAKIGSIVNGGAKEGKKLLNKFFTNLPKLGILLDKVKRLSASGYITGLDGRKLHVRSEHSALNTLLQSCGAIIAKQWCVEMYNEVQRRGLDAKLVAFVHDELQWDCAAQDAEAVGEIAVAMAAKAGEVLNFRLAVGADYSVGTTWKDTH